jgi:UDP-N-acetylglucosamine pyrophosphorylase
MNAHGEMPIEKMRAAGFSGAALATFERNYRFLCSGEQAEIAEESIEPVSDVISYDSLQDPDDSHIGQLLEKTAVIKLNGGLGTGMGLMEPKSLLRVRGELTFLDMIARQILAMRRKFVCRVEFLLMNSFSTSSESLSFLSRYPDLNATGGLEIMQSQVPKVDAGNLSAARYPANPELEWCPPGHGDIFPALSGSGWLDRLLDRGITCAFISNCDNLGATLDLKLLDAFSRSGTSLLMEVANRSEADRKGGHIARLKATGRLVLRESGQCPEEDTACFQDVNRHRFFNTNNIWLRLDALKDALDASGGVLPLPVIVNRKTVNPRDPDSPPVIQLETAMGAAIECFEKTGVMLVPRSRFAPVKNCSDLLALRSDAYVMGEDSRICLAPERNGKPPIIELDPDHYKYVEQVDRATACCIPSLVKCDRLRVSGPVGFQDATAFSGCVEITNNGNRAKFLPPGIYKDQSVLL